ncbi:MAG: endonuclease/exonuclease/phosphatase family protein [Planctomycetota bacterium]
MMRGGARGVGGGGFEVARRSAQLLVGVWLIGCAAGSSERTEINAPAEVAAALAAPAVAEVANSGSTEPPNLRERGLRVRIALFNVKELTTEKILDLDERGRGRHPQLRAAAEIIRSVRPDILVLQEIDHDYASVFEGLDVNARRFASHYLSQGDDGVDYEFAYAAPNNTGLPSGHDLDNDSYVATIEDRGTRRYGGDCFGYGEYQGQYSMAVLSRYALDPFRARTFQRFLWRDLPGNHLPAGFYSEEELALLPLSSKSHWDLTLAIDGRELSLWVCHPTPPVFDGPEDRNGRRNCDEIGFWVAYLDEVEAIQDDRGFRGGARPGVPFVIVGDLNAYPGSREGYYDGRAAIAPLLAHPRVQDPGAWVTRCGPEIASTLGSAELQRAQATAEFAGGVRVDYVLPSRELQIVGGGVYWPSTDTDPAGAARAETASDHRLVWLDLTW